MLFRAFKTCDIVPLIAAYKSYILPIADYCSSVWSPYLIGDIYAIESIQRTFTRKINGMKNIAYTDRLKILNLPSLELRRLRADLLMCFKIINGLVAGDLVNYGMILANLNSNTRGHRQKLFIDHTKIEVRKHFFANRIARPWNSLPADLIDSDSIFTFKRGLAKANLDKYLSQCF